MTKLTIKAIAVMAVSLSAITMFTRCGNPDSVFVGSVETVDMADNVRELKGVQLPDMQIPFPSYAVHDSLLISLISPRSNSEYHYCVSNVNSGEELGRFVASGHGENEFLALPGISTIYEEDGDMKALLFTPVNRKIFEWNITKSLKEGTTVLENIRSYGKLIENGRYFNVLTKIGNGEYVAKMQAYLRQPDDEPIPHHYAIIDSGSLNETGTIDIVKGGIRNEKCEVASEDFFSSHTRINPSNKKIVEAMIWLPQINIIDIATQEVKSYRISNSVGCEIFSGSMSDAMRHYTGIACDDDYIYALWKGQNTNYSGYAEWIHKYDWNGNMVERLHLDKQLVSLWLDEATGTLYGYSPDDDRVYAYSLGQ